MPAGSKLKALIGPHAGLRFSGPTAAWAYRNLAESASQYDRVVLMGPSHKVYLDFIGTTAAQEWETPLGNLKVDVETVESLSEQSEAVGLSVQKIQLKYEENEHSLELHLPYI